MSLLWRTWMQSRCAFGMERCLQHVKCVLRSSCVRRYPPKYPMIHDKGFLVLLLFSGLPASSACLSASEERKKHGTTSEVASSSFTTHHRNKRCRWKKMQNPLHIPTTSSGLEKTVLNFGSLDWVRDSHPHSHQSCVSIGSHTGHVCSPAKWWNRLPF